MAIAAPNFANLAEQTAASGATANTIQTTQNRPNQVDPYGNTSTWTIGPDGRPVQTTALSGANQGLYNQTQGIQSGLLGQAANTLGQPLNTAGMTNWGDAALGGGQFNMDPMGNSQAIQDATYKLLAPQRAIQRNQEIQRLKNQGLTEGSPAWNAALTRLDQGDTDAQLKSLLAGQAEYGNQFGRGLNQNQLNFGQRLQQSNFADTQRQNQFNERGAIRQQPLQDLKGLFGASTFMKPEFSQFASAGQAPGTDYFTAGQNQYSADLGNYNSDQAAKDRNISGGMDIIGGILGGAQGTAGNDIYNWMKNLWS